MKCSLIKSSMTIFLILLTFAHASLANYSSESQENVFSQVEAKFFSNFAKNANCAEKPLAQSCPQCLDEAEGYKFFFYFQTTRMKKFNYKMMMHYNDEKKKVAITFAGPNVQEHHNYIKFIYAKGFSLIKFYRINVEREYAMIYFGKFRRILLKKIRQISKSGRKNYEYILNGYSIGGSMATLAGFDLTRRRVVKVAGIYTFGSLRIGDATFVALVNATVRVWRVVKENDFIVRIPTCYYSPNLKVWRCFSKPIITKFITQKSFPLRLYVKSYLVLFRKSNPVLRKALGLKPDTKNNSSRKFKTSLKNLKVEEKKLNKLPNAKTNQKKQPSRKELARKEKLAEEKLKALLKKTKLEEMKKKLDNQKSLKKLKNISKKSLEEIIKKKTLKKIKQMVEKSKRKGLNPKKTLGKKIAKTKKKAKKLIKRLNKEIKDENIEEKKNRKGKKEKKEKKNRKGKKEKKEKEEKKEKKEEKKEEKKLEQKKETKQSDKEKNKEKKTLSPIKTVPAVPTPKTTVYLPTITTLTEVRTYTPIQIYLNFIYYTQPIGYEIFYNEEMTTYKTCEYSNGISVCESKTVLPTSFTIESHTSYFGVNFEQCTASK